MNTMSKLVLTTLSIAAAALSLSAHAQEAEKLKQYVYMLHVAPAMQHEKLWSDADNRVVGAYFARLQKAAKSGQVILAGRTTEPLDKTFGLVIFKAESHEAAERFMNEDPAVAAKLMTATLHPYAVAVQASPPAVASASTPKVAELASGDAYERNSSGRRSNAFFRSRCFAVPE
ncbi:MAG: hypothetical protein KBA96_05540 [Rhodocyclaceae bacterium]|nr:hypothetical protein [Rhodocyclaceae bacterium]MBP7080553.1 hypothetical protein [Rhodocyclaceae bacterium]